MWFLLLQIFVLMLLAAALGAALMWWWLNRRRADHAESRERLAAQASRFDQLATREDVEKELAALSALIRNEKPVAVDLQPIEERLMRVQSAVGDIRLPETDLGPLHQRLNQMEAKLSSLAVNLDPVMARVSDVGAAVAQIRPTDIRPIDERLSRIEGIVRDFKAPEVDLGPVHSGIASIGLQMNALEPVSARLATLEARLGELGARLEGARRNDMDTIAARFSNVSTALASLRIPDMAPVQSRLAEIQAAIGNIPPPNLAPVQASLKDLETFVMALDRPPPDFTPLHSRFAALEAALQPVDRRLAGLEEALGGMPGPDLEPVVNAVKAIDSRHDLVAVENRLTAIEYGLAAMHHMLRSRAEGVDGRLAPGLHVVREAPGVTVPPRPMRDSDPINVARRADDKANLLSEPAFGAPDDLELIDGVGPMLASLLHEIGVFYFWQVAEWTPEEIDWVESKLKHFRGRIRRDDWVGHARTLAAGPTAAKRPVQGGMRGKL